MTLYFLIAASFVFVAYKLAKCVSKPSHLKGIPSIPWGLSMLTLMKKKSFQETYPLIKKASPSDKSDFSSFWIITDWALVPSKAEHVKYILQRPDIFQKRELFDGSTSTFGNLVGQNVVFANGDAWRRLRNIINPAFREQWDTQVFGRYANLVVQECKKEKEPLQVNVHDWMQRLTLDSLGEIGFQYHFDSVVQPNGELARLYINIMEKGFHILYNLFPILDCLPHRWQFTEDVKKFRRILQDVINTRREEVKANLNSNNTTSKDIMTMLIKNMDAENDPLTDQELMENVFIFFVAGHDTTASALSATLHFLAIHQDIQEKVFQEVQRVVGADKPLDYIPSKENIQEFEYMQMVIKESLRMCPPVNVLPMRECIEDVTLGGHHFPKGTYFSVNVLNMHLSEDNFREPEKFIPERFSKENLSSIPPYAFLPFGGGSRICIGQSFSMAEQRVVLAILVRNFLFDLPAGSPFSEKLKFTPGGLARPEEFYLTFQPRVK